MTAQEARQAPARLRAARRRAQIGAPTDGPPARRESAVLFGDDLEIDHRDLDAADQRNNRGLLVEAAAREPEVRGVGRKLVERGIDGQPVAARRRLRRCRPPATRGSRTRRGRTRGRRQSAPVSRPPSTWRRTARCARCSRRCCVRSTSRADGRLTVGFFCTVALTKRVSASARARVPTALPHRLFRRSANVRIVAFDERLRRSGTARDRGRRARRTSFCASTISTMLPSMRCPTPCRSGDDRSAPSTRMRRRRTLRGSSIGGSGGAARSIDGNDG